MLSTTQDTQSIVQEYLALLDKQRESAFTALEGLSEQQIWQRPEKGKWCIGEILDHNYLLMASTMPLVCIAWRLLSWYGKHFRHRPYKKDIPDLYRDGKFPMWVGFLWTPRHNSKKPAALEHLKEQLRKLHREIRSFYAGKEEDILGNIAVYDPYFGWLNLIVTLRLGCYHDQLHYDDVILLANTMKRLPRYQR
jgi:hypothetical protein